MRVQHDIKPVPAAHAEFLRLLRSLRRSRRPVILTRAGEPHAVLVDVESYSLLREIALLIDEFREGRERAERALTTKRRRRR